MTHLEVLYKDRVVLVTSLFAKSGKAHRYVCRYLGRYGYVIGESKGGQLLVRFPNGRHVRAFPPGCVSIVTDIHWAM